MVASNGEQIILSVWGLQILKALGIAWTVLGTLVEVAIALIVLGAAEGKFQTITLAALAEIYAVVRSMGMGMWHTIVAVDGAAIERFVHLAKLLNDPTADEVARALASAKEKLKRGQVKMYIRAVGLGAIALVATYKLLAAAL